MKEENSSSSSSNSTSTTTAMEDRDSCYYPGCRKDANCNCEICIASMNATLDLMPLSIQKSSITKLSHSRPNVQRTPVSFSPSILSTPKSNPRPKLETPDHLKSTARLNFRVKKEIKRKRESRYRGDYRRFFLGLSLLFAVEIGFSWGICGVLKPVLSSDVVSEIGKRSRVLENLGGKLRLLQNDLKGFVADGKVSNCSHMKSLWKINQDGVLLSSRCILYKSAMEEVSIWGWPLQTAGMLKTGFSSRSFTVLSGRVSEWSDGMIGFSIRNTNSSWTQNKWGSSVVQLDPSTWVLEYSRSSILDCSSLSSAIAELFKQWILRVVTRLQQETWFFIIEAGYSELQVKQNHVKIPT